jgi:hypothetical protein
MLLAHSCEDGVLVQGLKRTELDVKVLYQTVRLGASLSRLENELTGYSVSHLLGEVLGIILQHPVSIARVYV